MRHGLFRTIVVIILLIIYGNLVGAIHLVVNPIQGLDHILVGAATILMVYVLFYILRRKVI